MALHCAAAPSAGFGIQSSWAAIATEGAEPRLTAGTAAGVARRVEEAWASTTSRMMGHSMAMAYEAAVGAAWKYPRTKATPPTPAPATRLEALNWVTGNVVVGPHGVIESAGAPGGTDIGSEEVQTMAAGSADGAVAGEVIDRVTRSRNVIMEAEVAGQVGGMDTQVRSHALEIGAHKS